MKRIGFIDQLKAVSIFFIVYGHNDYSTEFSDYLSSFRLPLFFILSGFVRKDKSDMAFSEFVRKLGKRLLIPYFLLSLMLYLIWFFVGRHYGGGVVQDPVQNFIGVFYSQGGPQYMDWGIPMWFLTALFCVLLIDYAVVRLPHRWQPYVSLLVGLAGYYYFIIVRIHLPWSLDVAMVVYPFYFFGGLIKERLMIKRFSNWQIWLIIGILFFMHMGLSRLNGKVLFYYGEYGILPLMYMNGFLGFFWLFFLFRRLPTIDFITWLGRNTLPVLALHLTAMSFIKAVLLFGFDTEVHTGIAYYFLYSILQIALLVPVIMLLNRCLPQFLGISKSG